MYPDKPLSYEEQLSILNTRFKEYVSQKVVTLYLIDENGKRVSPYKGFLDIQAKLKDRIRKQKDGEIS